MISKTWYDVNSWITLKFSSNLSDVGSKGSDLFLYSFCLENNANYRFKTEPEIEIVCNYLI